LIADTVTERVLMFFEAIQITTVREHLPGTMAFLDCGFQAIIEQNRIRHPSARPASPWHVLFARASQFRSTPAARDHPQGIDHQGTVAMRAGAPTSLRRLCSGVRRAAASDKSLNWKKQEIYRDR